MSRYDAIVLGGGLIGAALAENRQAPHAGTRTSAANRTCMV